MRHIYNFVRQFRSDAEQKVTGLLENPRLEIDVYIPSLRFGIELCGQYWHREQMVKSRLSHYDKWQQCKRAGIRLLTVFDTELYYRTEALEGYILSILHEVRGRVHARECSIINVSTEDITSFLDVYHMQGSTGADVNLGLIYGDEPVAVMTFNRVDKDGGWNLSRFCLKSGLRVPGAAGRLLTHFMRNYDYKQIISFSDNRYSNGNLYRTIGFTEAGQVKPSYYYFRTNKRELLHKFAFRKNAIESKFGPLLPGETEYQAMLRFGYDRIWDCGKTKWVLERT